MIETNLIAKKRKKSAPIILGVDLNKVNYVALALSLPLLYFPDWFLTPAWEDEKISFQDRITLLNGELRELNNEISQQEGVEDQLEQFEEQIRRLEERSVYVEEIINRRTNPRRVLETIARNTPEQMWFSELKIEGDNTLTIEGGADNYRSIGNFISQINNSPFFGDSIILENTQTIQEEHTGVTLRIEQFQIRGNVVNYDPF